jgi:hypothetical protein
MRAALPRQRQRGVALMAMLAVLILGATWWTVTALSNAVNRTAEQRAQSAQVLQQAKAALMGWVAHQAAMAGENDPGRLPCPEPAANIGTANQGLTANTCALPAVGRLPWRTLGLDQLRDASGEPLWYVVSPNWTLDGVVANTLINSNSTGQLALDAAAPGDVVALIVAPGAPVSVAASANCLARNQVRPSIDPRDYLECQNAVVGATSFVSGGPAGSFNDQVLAITGAELLPFIEAAVAHRFERDIAPQLRPTYAGWNAAAIPPLPFAAAFGDPTAAAAYGTPFVLPLGTTAGLMPISISETAPGSGVACTVAAQGPRCAPEFVAWTGAVLAGPAIIAPVCAVTPTQINCSYNRTCFIVCASGNVAFTLTATASNVGMAFRQLNTAANMTNVSAAGRNATGALAGTGAATITLTGDAGTAGGGLTGALGEALCGLLGFLEVCRQETISVPIALLADHAVFDPANVTFSWFFRNNWHQVAYYAVAPEIAPSGAGACAGCLTVNFRNPSATRHALIVISGRSLDGTARPNANSRDWLEDTNCDPAGGVCTPDTTFAVRAPPLAINRGFNDRIAVIAP